MIGTYVNIYLKFHFSLLNNHVEWRLEIILTASKEMGLVQ